VLAQLGKEMGVVTQLREISTREDNRRKIRVKSKVNTWKKQKKIAVY